MESRLYKAATEGKVDVLQGLIESQALGIQTTPDGNTVLHIASQFGQTNCVELILRLHASLLISENKEGERALHIAARWGHVNIVRALIDTKKRPPRDLETGTTALEELLGHETKEKNTALHEAAQYNHVEVVKLLIREEPEFPYSANRAGETPLFLAADRGYDEVVREILANCEAPAYDGPYGRTALHAAVTNFGHENALEMAAALLGKQPHLLKTADENGWTPLHCAASVDFPLMVEKLLSYDNSAAYLKDNDGGTPLHVAVISGATRSIEELISQCPDCYEMVDRRKRNALHFAVESGQVEVAKFIVKNPSFNSLLNKKDVDGNRPLHLLATSQLYIPDLIVHTGVYKNARNNQNKTALDILPPWGSSSTADAIRGKLERRGARPLFFGEKDKTENDDGSIRGLVGNHLIVAALIATVTFAAGFTLPGGYKGTGSAVLGHRAAFRAFAVLDIIALVLSISAVFMYFLTLLRTEMYPKLHRWAISLTTFATAAMALAFITGFYVALSESEDTDSLGIAICVMGCSFVFFYLYPLKLLYSAREGIRKIIVLVCGR